MAAMTWNNDKQAYYGETSNGNIVEVSGDEYAESLAYGIKEMAQWRGYDFENLTEAQREECEELTLAEIDDPETWAALVGSNSNVEFVEE